MDWIKVKVKHAEYDFVAAPDNVFRAWVMIMILTAAIEKIPTQKQIDARIGKENHADLVGYLDELGVSLNIILQKVLEDVDVVNHKRNHSREYMLSQRGGQPARRNDAKIREDKIREDKTVPSVDTNLMHKEAQSLINGLAQRKVV